MGYCFVNINKLKTNAALSASYEHNLREIEVPNADINLLKDNVELIDTQGKDYNTLVNEKIAQMPYYYEHPVRKNAVKAIEVMLTFSHEDMDKVDKKQWEQDSLKWLQETFKDPTSGKSNVLAATAHYDESTPHIHAICCLEYNGRINTIPFIGGRKKMAELQSSYALAMEKHGLERGVKYSKLAHEDIGRFYSQLTKSIQEQPVPVPEKDENINDYYQRVEDYAKDLKASYFRDKLREEHELAKHRQPDLNAKEHKELSSLRRYKERNEQLIREFGSQKDLYQKTAILNEIKDRADNFNDPEAQNFQEYMRLVQEELHQRDKELNKDKRHHRKHRQRPF